jgi:hypothetical protein
LSNSLGNITKFSTGADFAAEYGNTALRFYLLEIARSLLPQERIQVCWRYPLPARKTVEIIYSDERKCARTKGTMKCGSGWVCPACMSYIAARRREELQTAVNRSADKYASLMATYTVRHHAGMNLADLLSGMVTAYGKVFEGGWWTRTKADWMIRGAVRATEITWGVNGWHPHFHVLLFVDKEVMGENLAGSPAEYVSSLMPEIGARWLQKLELVGLSGDPRIAFDLRSSDQQIAEYIAKWGKMPAAWEVAGNAWEVAHATTKNAGAGHFGPLEILFRAAHDNQFKSLFREYHHATKGRSQLHWSKGLKTLLDIEVIKDELAAEGIETETDRILAELTIDFWRWIADRKFLGQVMTYANSGDDKRLHVLLDRLREKREGETVHLPQFDLGL